MTSVLLKESSCCHADNSTPVFKTLLTAEHDIDTFVISAESLSSVSVVILCNEPSKNIFSVL